MRKICTHIFFLCGMIYVPLFAQQTRVDSLEKLYSNLSTDSARYEFLDRIAMGWGIKTNDEAMHFTEKGLALAKKNQQGNWIIKFTHHIGNIYGNEGNFAKSLEYYLIEEKLIRASGNTKRIPGVYCGIGTVYSAIGNYTKALEYFTDGLKMIQQSGKKENLIVFYLNIGDAYLALHETARALEIFFKALKLTEELPGDWRYNKGNAYSSIALIYSEKKDYSNALAYYEKARNQYEDIGMLQRVASVLNGMGEVYRFQKKYQQAIAHYNKAIVQVKTANAKDVLAQSYSGLSDTYAQTKDFSNAYAYHKLFTEVRDSLMNADVRKQMNEMQAKYDSEKKQMQIESMLRDQEQQNTLAQEQNTKKNIIIASITFTLILVAVFSVFLYKRFRITRRQKLIIEKQKQFVEEKQKEVLDSIYYAKRIQTSLMSHPTYIEKSLNRLKSK